MPLAWPAIAQAGNGLNLIAVGFEPALMGGADLAVARDAFALASNPAGLGQIRGWNIEQHAGIAYGLDMAHKDPLNDSSSVENRFGFQGNQALAYGLTDLPVTLAAGLYTSGGSGGVFEQVRTPFGTRDELSSSFGIVRLAAGGGVRLDERWSLGASFGLAAGLLSQEVFPNTSVAGPMPFVGTKIDNAVAQGWSARLGVQFRPIETLTLGLTYAPQTDLPIEGDRLVANFNAQGLGNVQYEKVKIKGLAQAQELGIGAAWQVLPELLLAVDFTWLDWSTAMRKTTLRASQPEDAAAPPVLRATSDLDWRDQYVIGLGAAYQPMQHLTLYGGWNYGRNPVPEATTSPLLAVIGEHTLTAGLAWQVTAGTRVGLGFEWLLPTKVRYDNPDNPLGPDNEERVEYLGLHLGVSMRW